MANVIDLYPTNTGSFTVPADNAIRPFEQPFNSPPPTLAELLEPLTVAFSELGEAITGFARSFTKLAAELNQIPQGNRATRRRKHAPPARPGWMAAFPPPDPARHQRTRLAR